MGSHVAWKRTCTESFARACSVKLLAWDLMGPHVSPTRALTEISFCSRAPRILRKDLVQVAGSHADLSPRVTTSLKRSAEGWLRARKEYFAPRTGEMQQKTRMRHNLALLFSTFQFFCAWWSRGIRNAAHVTRNGISTRGLQTTTVSQNLCLEVFKTPFKSTKHCACH